MSTKGDLNEAMIQKVVSETRMLRAEEVKLDLEADLLRLQIERALLELGPLRAAALVEGH